MKESADALRAITRSINRDAVNPALQVVTCLTIYGLPLFVAGVFFPAAFDEIYLSFMLFVVASILLPRLVTRTDAAIADRYSVPFEARLGADEIRQKTPSAETSWSWEALSRLHILDRLVIFEFRDWSWLPLPNHLWTDEAAKSAFLDEVRERAPHLHTDVPAGVPSLFTLLSVGAGFGAMNVFLGTLFVIVGVARSESACEVLWEIGGKSVPFGLLYAGAFIVAVASFFAIRRGLRSLDGKRPKAAAVVSHLLIWPVPVALIIF